MFAVAVWRRGGQASLWCLYDESGRVSAWRRMGRGGREGILSIAQTTSIFIFTRVSLYVFLVPQSISCFVRFFLVFLLFQISTSKAKAEEFVRVMHDADKTGEWGFSVHEDKASQARLGQPRPECLVCHPALWALSAVVVAARGGCHCWLRGSKLPSCLSSCLT